MTFILLADSFLLALLTQAAMLERLTWEGIKGGLWPTALKEWNPANIHISTEENLFPIEPSDEITALSPDQHLDCSLLRDPEAEGPAKPCLVS